MQIFGVQLDTDRQTLHHFNPVACGVLCRDHRKCGARTAGKTSDHTMVGHIITIQICR
ncbi:Uncharacterised protein [Vibrio cholerae]|nr:Uncharacterised protein [Vibrio cholerae]